MMAKEQSNETALSGIIMPSGGYLPGTASSSLMPGNHYSTGMTISGIVKRITMNPTTGVVTFHVAPNQLEPEKTRRVFLWPTGMVSEEAA